MKNFNADRQQNLEINNLLQRIKYEANKQQAGAFIYFPIFVINVRNVEYKISPSGQILFKELKKRDAIELRERSSEEVNKTLKETNKSKNKPLIAEGYWVRPIEPKFSQLCKEYERKVREEVEETSNLLNSENIDIPEKFKVEVKDRDIFINKYRISKPHAVGSNYEFFEYIHSQKPNTKISRDGLPSGGSGYLQNEIQNKSFIKILNEIGFKGEILKAFFYKRGKDTLIYRGNEINKKDLENNGIKIPLFIQELKTAHIKNSPE